MTWFVAGLVFWNFKSPSFGWFKSNKNAGGGGGGGAAAPPLEAVVVNSKTIGGGGGGSIGDGDFSLEADEMVSGSCWIETLCVIGFLAEFSLLRLLMGL